MLAANQHKQAFACRTNAGRLLIGATNRWRERLVVGFSRRMRGCEKPTRRLASTCCCRRRRRLGCYYCSWRGAVALTPKEREKERTFLDRAEHLHAIIVSANK